MAEPLRIGNKVLKLDDAHVPIGAVYHKVIPKLSKAHSRLTILGGEPDKNLVRTDKGRIDAEKLGMRWVQE